MAIVRGPLLSFSLALAAVGGGAAPALAQPAVRPPSARLTPYLVALSVANVDSSFAWYRRLLGFQPLRAPYAPVSGIRIGFLIQGDFRLELIEAVGARPRRSALPDSTRAASLQGFIKLAFRISNLDSAATVFRRAGVPFLFGPATDSSFRVRHFIIADPDGNALQFFQPLGPP